MAYIIPNQGEQKILSGGFNLSANNSNDVTAGLFSSALTFTATMTLTSVTFLTAGSAGTSTAVIKASAWSVPFVSAGSAAISASGNASNGGFQFGFSAAPNQSAFGYAIFNAANLIVVESFSDGPYWLSNAGDTVTVTPYIKLGSGTNN